MQKQWSQLKLRSEKAVIMHEISGCILKIDSEKLSEILMPIDIIPPKKLSIDIVYLSIPIQFAFTEQECFFFP